MHCVTKGSTKRRERNEEDLRYFTLLCAHLLFQPTKRKEPKLWRGMRKFEIFYAFICWFSFQVWTLSTTKRATKPFCAHRSSAAPHEPGGALLTSSSASPQSCWKPPAGKSSSRQPCPWPTRFSVHLQWQISPIQPCSRGRAAAQTWHLLVPVFVITCLSGCCF